MLDWRTELQRVVATLVSEAGRGSGALMTRASDRLDRPEALRFITDAFPAHMAPFLAAAGDIAATLYEDLPGGVDGFRAVTADLPSVSDLAAVGRYLFVNGLEAAIESAITTLINRMLRDTTFENLGLEYGDPVIVENPEAVLGTLWARHASANACGFCRVMATKGPVFQSETSATRVVGRGGKPRGTRKLGDKWHDNCHCVAIAVRPGGKYEPASYVEQWQRDYDRAVADGHTGIGSIANAMDYGPGGRRYKGNKPAPVEPEASDTAAPPAGTVGGTNKPPTKPPTGGQAVQGDGEDWDEAERKRREEALGIDTHGDPLTRSEIEFVERFQAAGQHLEWIARDPKRRPTNDFTWVEKGVEVEQKSTKARYETIHGRIVDAAAQAAKQGVIKDNFLIDIGNAPLNEALRAKLARFNDGRRKYRLNRLWVMTQGRIEEIDLRGQ